DPVLLEMEVPLPALINHVEPRLDPLVAHREDRGLDREPSRDPRGHLGEGEPAGERSRPEQVRREVEVPEPEPGCVRIEAPELLVGAEGLVAPPPPALAIERVAEPVGDGVE